MLYTAKYTSLSIGTWNTDHAPQIPAPGMVKMTREIFAEALEQALTDSLGVIRPKVELNLF